MFSANSGCKTAITALTYISTLSFYTQHLMKSVTQACQVLSYRGKTGVGTRYAGFPDQSHGVLVSLGSSA